MKCLHCKKKYVYKKGATPNICPQCLQTGLAFYKLGLQDGERRLRQTINALAVANKTLWDEMTDRLDAIFPLDNTFVRVPIPLMKKIVVVGKSDQSWQHYKRQLRKLMREQLGNLPDLADNVGDGEKGSKTNKKEVE